MESKKGAKKKGGQLTNSNIPQRQFELVRVSKLRKAPWNYKEEDEELSEKLLNAIKRSGQTVNIIVREIKDGNYEVVDGNHRVDVFQKLDLDEVYAVNLGRVSVAEAKRQAVEVNETKFTINPKDASEKS